MIPSAALNTRRPQVQSGRLEVVKMTESNSPLPLEKTCVVWSRRRERDIALRVFYDVRELDGCRIYTLNQVQEMD
jgi:hypothetical protein